MKDPTSKSELIQAIRTARNEWDTLIAQIPRNRVQISETMDNSREAVG